jgi:hypothetical protein
MKNGLRAAVGLDYIVSAIGFACTVMFRIKISVLGPAVLRSHQKEQTVRGQTPPARLLEACDWNANKC